MVTEKVSSAQLWLPCQIPGATAGASLELAGVLVAPIGREVLRS